MTNALYAGALRAIVARMNDGAAPREVAAYVVDHTFGETREAIVRRIGVHAWPGTYGAAVAHALEEAFAAADRDRKRQATDDVSNPRYPTIRGVDKFRKLANKRDLTAEETKAYGQSVLEGIRKLQRAELMRCLGPAAPSADYETGADVLARIAAENKRAFARDCQSDRAARTDAEIIAEYHRVMAEKRAAQAADAPQRETANVMTYTAPAKRAKPAVDHSARMRKAWETRRANAAKRAA